MNQHDHASTSRWNAYFIKIAHDTMMMSKDPSTQVGAVAVRDGHIISTGYNGFPRGVHDTAQRLLDRTEKLLRTVHAEENVIADCARRGVSLDGATVYITAPPCNRCVALLIQAGVDKIKYLPGSDDFMRRWLIETKLAREMCCEAGVFMMELG